MSKLCKGCGRKVIYCVIQPKFKYKNKYTRCPCLKCLVKPMCKVNCDSYEEYKWGFWGMVKNTRRYKQARKRRTNIKPVKIHGLWL